MLLPERVLHPVMEVLFGEAREFTAGLYSSSTGAAKENGRRQALSMCMNLHTGQAWLTLYPDYTQNPPVGCQSVSDTRSLAKVVRKVEFKLLQLKGITILSIAATSRSGSAVS